MGWIYPQNTKTKGALVDYLRDKKHYSGANTLLKSCVAGKAHYYLMKCESTGVISIGIDLMTDGGPSDLGGWGYKRLSFCSQPYVYDCPLAFFDIADPLVGYAIVWREKVRVHQEKNRLQKPPVIIEFGVDQLSLQY